MKRFRAFVVFGVLAMDGHMDVPAQGAKDLQEPEEEDSSPSCSPSVSPAWRLPSSCPNMKHYLKIQVTLMDELGLYTCPLILGWPH